MTPTTLSPTERLQLVNQYRILEKLYPDEAPQYAAAREIFANGYTVQYDQAFQAIYEEIDIVECLYVYDVLDLYRTLHRSYEALTDKQELTASDVSFRGFDGNNETNRHSFVTHLQQQGRWAEILLGTLNSHSMSTMSLYPRMLTKFEPMRQNMGTADGGWLLTAEQIQEVIS